MTKQPDNDRDRLTAAALDAARWLRNLRPELETAIARTGDPGGLLVRLRDLAAVHADKLRLAVKRPEPPNPRNTPRRAAEPLWGVSQGQAGGRYQRPAQARHSRGV
ncbi:MAG TPA: hypothetical protein VN442_00315 [Bryobacteraceae bacterium]|nr:hypothetical protein [Bryobacteraceae bacterium]